MQIEGWMVTAFFMVMTGAATFAVMRYRIEAAERANGKQDAETQRQFEQVHTKLNAYGNKIDEHSETLREQEVLIGQAPSMREVRQEFVTKELFQQHKEHLDRQFERINKHIDSHGTEMVKAIEQLERKLKMD